MSKENKNLISRNDKEDEDVSESLVKYLIGVITKNGVQFIRDEHNEAYAIVDFENKVQTLRIGGKKFLNYINFVAWKSKITLSQNVKSAIIDILESKAAYEGRKETIHLRTAWNEDVLWYDLGNGKAVKITEDDWEISNSCPVYFHNFNHQEEQVEPEKGGSILDVLKYLNFDNKEDGQKCLIFTFLVVALIPNIARAILTLSGQQGSAKSTFLRILKSLIDPSKVDILTFPKNQKDFVQIFSHHYFVTFDNLSHLTAEQSDDLCRACTGQGFSKRALYTNDDDILYSYKRVIGINGINTVASKPDLLDRCLIIELEPISKTKRADEEFLWKNFRKEKPKILGAIFTLLSKAIKLRQEKKIELKEKPRLADYANWAATVNVAMGGNVEEFLEAYKTNVDLQTEEAIEGSTLAQTIISYMEEREHVEESSKDIYEHLKEKAIELGFTNDEYFPKSPRGLWKKIKPLKTVLQNQGIECRYINNERPRLISIVNRNLTSEKEDSPEIARKKIEDFKKEVVDIARSKRITGHD